MSKSCKKKTNATRVFIQKVINKSLSSLYICFMKFFIFIIFMSLFGKVAFNQTIFYQDVFHGGVTGDGFNPFVLEAPGTLDIHIEPNSTIRKAYLFVTVQQADNTTNVLDNSFEFNGTTFAVKWSDAIGNEYSLISGSVIYRYKTIVFDVTNHINPSINSYTLVPAQNQNPVGALNGIYSNYYLFVSYNNAILPTVGTKVILNNQNAQQTLIYNTDIDADLNYNIGFTFNSHSFCDTVDDGSYVFVNGNNIGLVGGNELGDIHNCTGVRGAFYYQNNQLYGLDDDTSTPFMNGTDALALIENYITNPSNITIQFEYQTPGSWKDKTNPVNQLFLTYTSPCDTFSVSVPSDTTICYGEQLQLNVSGGQRYEWTASTPSNMPTNPAPGLSCSDCPNPIFTGNNSMVYTVRIWNNDSCSVVRPVRVNVNHPNPVKCYTGETKCGFENGYISINSSSNFSEGYFAVTPDDDTLSNFTNNHLGNLGAGDYKVYYIDAFGCKSKDTLVTIETYNNTIADFSVDPSSGTAPLETTIENQSQNATHFEWFVNNESTGDNPINIFDLSGEYKIGLVAWEGDASCADTTWKTIFVYDNLVVTLPNVFTPNNDGVNDYFNVKTNLAVSYQLSVLNRWGNVVFEKEDKLAKGVHNLWDGKTKNNEPVTDGTYFYTITFKLDSEEVDCEITKCEAKKEGFVQVFGK